MNIEECCRRFAVPLSVLFLLLSAPSARAQDPAPEVACPDCNDFNNCTVDSCDTSTGTCRHNPLDCDDHNPCTVDTCAAFGFGGCGHTNLAAGTFCTDGNSCTQADSCQIVTGAGMQCIGTIQSAGTTCDDANSCTTSDTCSETGVCQGSPSTPGAPCDDASQCTSNDICVASPEGAISCQGAAQDCGDGDLCTQDLCDPTTGGCTHPPVDCNDGNACTGDSCDPATGACQRSSLSGSCSDGQFCTVDESCSGGNCVGGAPRSCDDHADCTHDSCGNIPPQCLHIPDNSLCPPPGACFSYTCLAGQISGCQRNNFSQVPCDRDGSPCTIDQCVRGFCEGAPVPPPTGPCDDHDACTINDRCGSGHCTGTPLCPDDNNLCTSDTCNPFSTECSHQVLALPATCGVGACRRDVDTCAGGVFQPCVPGDPAPEVCNGIDDDCDGLTDENGVVASCTASPSTLNLNSNGSSFSLTCKLSNMCDPGNPVPISGDTVSQTYISRIDDATLPDPSTLPCPDPVLGSLYERGISENLGARDVSNANVTFKFNGPSDGQCSTLDGDRQDLAARLTAIPDNTNATVCISGRAGVVGFQACVVVLVKNSGLR